MNTTEKLALWLGNSKRDYTEGLSIFKELNIDVKKLPFFAVTEPQKIHQSLLLRHLDTYARVNGIKAKKNEAAAEPARVVGKQAGVNAPEAETKQRIERPKIDTNPTVKKEELPEDLQLLFDENGQMNNEIKTYHAELKACADDDLKLERRKWLANMIVKCKTAMRENWEKIDSWWNNKAGKTPEQQAAEDAIRQKNRIAANLNYIRRYYNTTKESQKAELEKRKAELDQWGVSYEELVAKVAVSE